ncbi:hypothetical protein PRZ48_013339 [Zasmidium cellare]|uniref:Uncharacterized protein n=1 Tax=Zasmidium cellare TaxID=395010 RepID=A0ABR0E0Q4_ZASCE|nr:hypothetical protein PRZ48_013339 [Zasmidium cellare]
MAKYGPSVQKVDPPPPPGPTSAEDWAIITDLLETIERDPSSIEARRVLAQQYEAFGWTDQAAQEIRTILSLRPGDEEAAAWLIAHLHKGGDKAAPARGKAKAKDPASYRPQKKGTLQDLQSGYKTLMDDAKALSLELQIFQDLCGPSHNLSGQISDLKAIAEGRLTSVVKVRPPPATRAVAIKIKAASTLASREEVAFNDLEDNARYLRSRNTPGSDELRAALLKRSTAIKSSLPKDMAQIPDTAFMHIEHEILRKTYRNTETMLGDSIGSIPRASFFASEDGYAWDMSELATAIRANAGVMRNPLSREMFSAEDVGKIVTHPQGKELGALQLQQKELTKGVRKETTDRLARMATVLLDDQSADSAPSRAAVEDFTLYVATLPQAEQEALDRLKVPAKDSHTGNAFDTTVGDAVADAKANRQCFHKTADLLRQAAKWLRENGGTSGKDAKMPGAWE